MSNAVSGFVFGIFISCLFIQWSVGRISSKLDDVVFILRQLRERGEDNG